MKLSILTPTIPDRIAIIKSSATGGHVFLGPGSFLVEKLKLQIGNLPVEHLVLCDNKTRTIGAKRQALVDIARGDYLAFVDDDDDISNDYVASLLAATESGADVITFHQKAIYNGLESEVHFGLNNRDEAFNPGGVTLRAPWHVCAWKRAAIASCQFGETNYGEDRIWSLQARQRVKTGWHVPKVLHTYRHDAKTTEAPEPL